MSRIYICSRTHSQVSQLIKGLKTTVYTPSMAVLGSREQLCINPTVMRSSTKNEDCSKLIDGHSSAGCSFFSAYNVLASHPSMRGIWDIEDVVSKGRQFHACPFFTAKDIAETADVVFCPYSYLIDKGIRESSGISLTNNVVIFDEAHNLEDQCREAASFSFSDALVSAAVEVIIACRRFPGCPYEAEPFLKSLQDIRSWIKDTEQGMGNDEAGERSIEFVKDTVTQQFTSMGLSAHRAQQLSDAAKKVQEWHKEASSCCIGQCLTSTQLTHCTIYR